MKKTLSVILSVIIMMTFAFTSLGASVAVKSIKINTSNITLQVGKTYALKVTITPANATNKKLTYSSTNKKIAAVDTKGIIKGIKAGKTVITVTSSSNKKAVAKCNVTIIQKAEKLSIGLSLATLQEERWVRDKETMEAEAKAKGIDLAVQVANMDAAKQDAQCENLISQGIKVLIIAAQDSKSAAAIVDKAHKAGVKVISYDRLIMGTDVDIYISFDNVSVGELQGKWLTDNLPKGNIVWLSGAPTDNNAKLFKQGAAKYLEPKIDSGEYKVVMEQGVVDWKPDNALKLMENALTANNNDIQGVLAPNDGTAGGCIQAMAAQGLAGKVPITGQDAELQAAQRIVQGTQGMTVFKDTRELGKAAIAAAIKMAAGQDPGVNNKVNNDKMDVPSILLVPVAVDKNNIDKVLIDSGYLKKEDVYKK